MKEVICPYCGCSTVLVDSSVIYGQDGYGYFYLCIICGAYVGCHGNTTEPLGYPANKELRDARRAAHSVFDRIWKTGKMRRRAAYAWLSEQLKIPAEATHISMFNLALCQKTIEICSREKE